jgi:hypothetical protein
MQKLHKILLTILFSLLVAHCLYAQQPQGNSHVNGGGSAIEFGKRSTFVFNAVETNGSVVGHLIYHLRVFNVSFKMSLDCMEIRGNRATLSGMVESVTGDQAPSYIFPGSRASFTVEDNGNGRNKDRISDVFFGARCTDDLDTYIPIQGNISIH